MTLEKFQRSGFGGAPEHWIGFELTEKRWGNILSGV